MKKANYLKGNLTNIISNSIDRGRGNGEGQILRGLQFFFLDDWHVDRRLVVDCSHYYSPCRLLLLLLCILVEFMLAPPLTEGNGHIHNFATLLVIEQMRAAADSSTAIIWQVEIKWVWRINRRELELFRCRENRTWVRCHQCKGIWRCYRLIILRIRIIQEKRLVVIKF